jgi:hypothetical protein
MTATATTPHPVWHATLAGLPLEGSPSLRLGVILVRRARQITIPTRPQLARRAHPVVTQRSAMQAYASGVQWVRLQRLRLGQA